MYNRPITVKIMKLFRQVFHFLLQENLTNVLNFTEANNTIQRSSGEINAAAGASSASAETEVRQLKEEIAVLHRVVAGRWLIEIYNN